MANNLRTPTPDPTVGFREKVEWLDLKIHTFSIEKSGSMTSGSTGDLFGASVFAGQVVDAVLAANECGRDDTDNLALSVDLKVNGTSVLKSNPTITGVSGEASTRQVANSPTIASGEVSRGDIFTADFNLTRATPDTEMSDVVFVVSVKDTNL